MINLALPITTAVIIVPGLAIGIAMGLRGWLLAGSTPLLTYGVIGAAGSALPLVGITWSPAVLAITSAAVAIITASLRFATNRRHRSQVGVARDGHLSTWSLAHHLGVLVGVLVATAIGGMITYAATRGFTAVPQVWDAVFHSNAIRYIAETGQSDPAALRNLNNPTTTSYYYPNAYHVLAATVVMVTGDSVPTVLDAGVFLFPGLLSLGMATLIRQIDGRPALAASAALLSCAFTALPYDLLPWGTLLPFITSVVLLPAFLALFATVLRSSDQMLIALPVALGLGGIGLLALHPSGAVAGAVLSIALLTQVWFQRRPRRGDFRSVGLTILATGALGGPLLLASVAAAAGPAFDWPTTLRPGDAMGELLFLSHDQLFPQYWLVGLILVGMFRARTLRPAVWLIAGSLVFAGLFVMAASYESDVVALLTRPWWNDKWRFAGLWTLGAILLAAAGLVGIRDALWKTARRILPGLHTISERRRLILSATILTAAAAVIIGLTNGLYHSRNEIRLAQAFTDGPTVSTKERLAFDKLAQIVPEGSIVMNDPYDGSAMMWALNDVRPVFASPVIALQELPTMDPNRRILFESFNRIDSDPGVQAAVDALNIKYVIICTGFIAPAGDHVPGMQNLNDVAALDLVFENSDARIYAIDYEESTKIAG